ncbi:PQQ-binding-like beta-propeller repeat protein [Thermoproteota archaeon]
MKKSINKTKATAIIILTILITSSFILVANITVQAQTSVPSDVTPTNVQEGGSIPLPTGTTPDYEVVTNPYLSVRPATIGLNQIFLVNLWTEPAVHASRYLSDYKVTITKPSGTEDVILVDSYRADSTAWFEYIADEIGEWTIQFDFQGAYFPVGNYTSYPGAWIGPQVWSFVESAYYLPKAAAPRTLMVQEEPVLSWPYGEPSTDYWERPVSPENRGWWPILGYFPSTGVTGGGQGWPADTNIYMNPDYDFVPYVQGPETSHIVWKRTDNIGGLIGGVAPQECWTSGGNAPSIIYAGRCYDSVTKVVDGLVTSVWQCYDLRTGEVYWERDIDTSTPNFVMYQKGFSEVPGGGEVFGRNMYLCSISGGNLNRYNPTTGALSQQIDLSPLTSATLYGDDKFVSLQNLGGQRYLIEWTLGVENLPRLQTVYTVEVLNNVTWPWNNLGDSQDFESMIAFDVGAVTPPAVGAWVGLTLRAADMKTGQELWSKTIEDDKYFSSSTAVADHGKGAVAMGNGYWLAWDLRTGNQAWKSEITDLPWGMWWPYSVSSAYGMIIDGTYAGMYAIDWDDGSIVWFYEDETEFEFETAYVNSDGTAVNPFRDSQIIADGKVYTRNQEHTPGQPLTRGWSTHCIDAFTGEGLWEIAGYGSAGAIADGYLVVDADYLGQTLVIGKGKSATTVTAPDVAVPKGTAFTIKGTVLDQSPAQPGTPCVSPESMSTQMEYLHMQRPISGLHGDETINGVTVMLSAIAYDGSYVDIGTVITEGYSGTFGHSWTPTEEGTYKIIASFEGDASYGSSSSTTWVTVGPEASSGGTIEPEPTPETPLITTEIAIIAAVAVAVVIGIVAYWGLKKRQ